MIHRRRLALAISGLMIAAGAAIVFFAVAGGGKSKPRTIPLPVGFANPTSTATPPATPTPPPSDAAITRLVIPKIKVSAGIQVLGLSNDGAMLDPKGPLDVGWYDLSGSYADFSSYPGWGGNAVFAGHVDYVNYGAAVFWHLGELKPDDDVQVQLADGTQYNYKVISLDSVAETSDGQLRSIDTGATESISDVVGPVGREVVTLITCGGTFNTRTRQYDKRLIVRAERVISPDTPHSN